MGTRSRKKTETKAKVEAKPAGPLTADDILAALMRNGLAGHSGEGIPRTSPFDHSRKTDLTEDPVFLQDPDVAPLIAAGLLARTEGMNARYVLTPAGIRAAMALVKPPQISLPKLLDWVLDRSVFHPATILDGKTAIPYRWVPGHKGSRLVLVLGENGAGKSLFRRFVRGGTDTGNPHEKVRAGPCPVREFLGLSMEGRGASFASLAYGLESHHSTGANSARTVLRVLETVAARPWPTVLYLDEPDLGMSVRCAAGIGITIRDFIATLETQAPLAQAVFVTSHSPALVRALAGLEPHYVYLGDAEGPPTLGDWIADQESDPPPIAPGELKATSQRRFLQIRTLIRGKREDEEEEG